MGRKTKGDGHETWVMTRGLRGLIMSELDILGGCDLYIWKDRLLEGKVLLHGNPLLRKPTYWDSHGSTRICAPGN
jgi:hypothetical protein